MRAADQFAMSVNNLKRRKLRTFLTVLGVVIGSASIVVMVSLGIGLKELNRELVESSGSLTTIQVQGDMDSTMTGGNSSQKPRHLTDQVLKEFAGISHVKSVYPFLEVPIILRQGVYQANLTLRGAVKEYLSQIHVSEDKIPKEKEQTGNQELRLLYGSDVIKDFSNRRTGKSFWDTQTLPNVDLVNGQMFVIFDTDAFYESQSDTKKKPPKKYLLKSMGVLDESSSGNNAYAVYTDLDQLSAQLKKIFKKKPVPGQPVKGKNKPYPYLIYNVAEVNVDNVKHVKEVQQKIIDAGYQASSNIEWLEQSEKQSGMIQAVLGGIGAVSLFVAAIGIANTMMMSIYERTKEIGILKVLGCDLGAIRNMFLMESGMIGFLGGVSGVILSCGASFVINHFLKLGESMTGVTGNISRIPIWLALAAVVFSVFIGMLAGLFPALRAMKLSPLSALRNE